MYARKGSAQHYCACTDIAWAHLLMISDLVCMHIKEASRKFVWRTENMLVDYFQNLGKIRSGVVEKSAYHWLCMFISNFSLYFQLYSKLKVPSTQTAQNYYNPFGIFENLLSKCPSFSGKMTYFLANIVISSPSY